MPRFRTVVSSVVSLLLLGAGPVVMSPPAAAAPVVAAPAGAAVAQPGGCPREAVDERSARVVAQRCRTRVEVTSARTERVQVFSNPDGTTSWEESVLPRRVHRADGIWSTVDRRLRTVGSRLAPGATLADVSFSPGGPGPMAVLREGGHTFSLDWPGVLPAPVVSGDQATYRDVRPGVDLVLRATTGGFSHVLVVRTAAAAADPALARIAYRVGGDVTLATTAAGLVARAADGTVLAAAPAASMWDSALTAPPGSAAARAGLTAQPSTVDGPGDAARRQVLTVTADAGALVVSADRAFLTDRARVFPLYLDPSWAENTGNGAYWGYTMYPYTENSDGRAWVGLDPWWGQVYRSTWEFPTTAGGVSLVGKHILSAQFNITESHSYSCGQSPVYLWWTDSIPYAGHVPWAPNPIALVQEFWAPSANKSGDVCPVQPDVALGFTGDNNELTGYVQSITTAGWSSFGLSLTAYDGNWAGEYNQSRWKKFWPDTATLVINYNSYPYQPKNLRTNPGAVCQSTVDPSDTAGLPRVNTSNAGAGLVLRTELGDPDGGVVEGKFEVWPKASRGTGAMAYDAPLTAMAASGSTFETTIPAATFTEGGAYSWRVFGSDSVDSSNWSQWCDFVVDTTAPGAPQIASTELNGRVPPSVPGTPTAVVRAARPSPVTFTAAAGTPPGEVAGYLYGLTTATSWAPADASGAATVMVAPVVSGIAVNKLVVLAVDRAGNRSALPTAGYSYGFKANAGTAAWWPTRESAGPLVDLIAAKNLTLSGTAGVGAGTATFGGGSGATTGAVLTTTGSFTVAAWARVTNTSVSRAVVAQAGTRASGFSVQYEASTGKWRFDLPKTDVAAPAYAEVRSSQPAAVGTWVHLVAVYDTTAQQLRLYVNGALDGTVAYTTAHWSATGAFRVGQEQVNAALVNPFAGDIADVRAWGSTLDTAAIATLAAQPPRALDWSMDDPAAAQLADTAGLTTSHAGTLAGGAGMLAGHRGSALVTGGGGPMGASSAGVVHTNGSFSVSAWVKISSVSAGYANAVSGDGAVVGMFGLGLNPDNQWVFWMHTNDTTACGYAGALAATTATVGTWTHLAGTYDVASHQLALYVNGTLAATTTMATPWDATQRFAVGFGRWNSADTYQWQGSIDEVRAFPGVLSAAQVASLAA